MKLEVKLWWVGGSGVGLTYQKGVLALQDHHFARPPLPHRSGLHWLSSRRVEWSRGEALTQAGDELAAWGATHSGWREAFRAEGLQDMLVAIGVQGQEVRWRRSHCEGRTWI